jgi:hypothetical protein
MSIWYELHPVAPARKAELRAKGYKIIDARFAPADWISPDALQAEEAKDEAQAEAPVKRRGRRPKMEFV